jgi:hypothetical protein
MLEEFNRPGFLRLVSYLAYFPTLEVKNICTSETPGSLRTAQNFNPEGRTFCSYVLQNLKFNVILSYMCLLKVHYKLPLLVLNH